MLYLYRFNVLTIYFMARKKNCTSIVSSEKTIIVGGKFSHACYRLSPLGEDLKNSIVSLLQFMYEGRKLNGNMDMNYPEGVKSIYTEYGEAKITKLEHPVNKRLQPKYIFTVPMQFFIKGRRTDGRFYLEIEKALRSLAECRMSFTNHEDGTRHYIFTGIIDLPETLTPMKGETGRNSIVSFQMSEIMIELILNTTNGYHKFIERECIALTSIYAKRMYQILCSQNGGSSFKMEVSNFKKMFCITDKYARNIDLERKVLRPLRDDINERTSLKITYEIVKSLEKNRVYIIRFSVIRNESLLIANEMKRRYLIWPKARLAHFLTEKAMMKKSELRPHLALIDKVSKEPRIMGELEYKWSKTCERIPLSENCSCPEKVRKERIAHLLASLKGMLKDYNIH